MNRCRHCGRAQKTLHRLCWGCNRDPELRAKYLSRRQGVEPSDAELDELCAAGVADHSDFRPAECPVASAEYCAVVAARERLGLPARHPADPPLDLR